MFNTSLRALPVCHGSSTPVGHLGLEQLLQSPKSPIRGYLSPSWYRSSGSGAFLPIRTDREVPCNGLEESKLMKGTDEDKPVLVMVVDWWWWRTMWPEELYWVHRYEMTTGCL